MRFPAPTCLLVRIFTSAAPCALALATLFCASTLQADTIILKNGRKIVAANIVESDGKVTYQTPAGEMSIPQSIVDHIDKNDFAYTSAADAAKTAAASVHVDAASIAPASGYDAIAALAVHDDAIDYEYLARLDNQARFGSAIDIAKDAAAHHIAAQFLIQRGNTSSAIDQYKQALVFSPQNTGLLLNIAVLYLRQSRFTDAIDALEQARRVAPNSADVAKLEGWAYYGSNKLDQAVAEWRRSQKLRPDADVAEALQKAERDKSEEETYREGETAHFDLKYSGAATPDLAAAILATLEDDFNNTQSQLDYTPPEQIGVILYTNQAFADITRAPGWVGALNDGRLRIPVQGLTGVTPQLARVLKHELTHSFVGQKTRGRAPTWLQEGIAQYMEGLRSGPSTAALLQAASQDRPPQFNELEGSWMELSGDSAAYAYAWSLAAVESIVASGGIGDVSRLLDRMAVDPSSEKALESTLHENYSDLATQTIQYLQGQYGH
ncbi:MAG TPA: tetratricopeptide repeat protein [Candidatus Acidoferrales bacterium]|nr:tetratricopeptide repeat protein [Candidatus Acidoferrales bacterium]